jgi:murein DD-endopeptidase MepM/ murein hydrolase activator NlpD
MSDEIVYGLYGTMPKEFIETNNYSQIIEAIAEFNNGTSLKGNERIANLKNESNLSYLRGFLDDLQTPKLIEKDEEIGVVLEFKEVYDANSKQIINKVYVNVPSVNIERLSHPDILFDPAVDLSQFEHLVFYELTPISQPLRIKPQKGDIVKVKLAPNYPNHIFTNPFDNKYLGIFRNNFLLPSTNIKQVPTAREIVKITLKEARESLIEGGKPQTQITKEDLIGLPFGISKDGKPGIVSSMPAIRAPPKEGVAYSRGSAVQGHYALDVFLAEGSDVLASTNHIILEKKYQDSGFGNYLVATGKKYAYIYAHLSESTTTTALKGETIAKSGKTGGNYKPHLHFEIKERLSGRKVSPLYFINGTINLNEEQFKRFKFKESRLKLPLPLDTSIDDQRIFLPNENFDQVVIAAEPPPPPENKDKTKGKPSSNPTTIGRLSIVNFDADFSKSAALTNKKGSKIIKIREDLLTDLIKVKNILNDYNISFTLEEQAPSINNNDISLLAKVGLEIKLNPNAGLNEQSNLNLDDYLIGPDYSKPIGAGYKLKVYTPIRRDIDVFDKTFLPENLMLDIYDVRETYLKKSPKIIKINKKVFDLTKILESLGFVQVLPKQEFFKFSDYKKSNWFFFQKPSKLIKGYTYNELLSTVYTNNGEAAWNNKLVWDGSRFI